MRAAARDLPCHVLQRQERAFADLARKYGSGGQDDRNVGIGVPVLALETDRETPSPRPFRDQGRPSATEQQSSSFGCTGMLGFAERSVRSSAG